MTSHDHHAPPTAGDLAYETFYSAAIGGLVVALFFLLVDLAAGRPLFTPSLIGEVLFFGAEAQAVEGVDLGAMAAFTVVHLAAFGILGLVSTFLVRFVEGRTGGGFAAPAIILFVLLEGGFLAFAEIIVPGVAAVVGQGMILLANGLAALTMTAFLRYAHATGKAELDAEEERRAAASG